MLYMVKNSELGHNTSKHFIGIFYTYSMCTGTGNNTSGLEFGSTVSSITYTVCHSNQTNTLDLSF